MGLVGYSFRAEMRSSGRQLLVTAVVFGLAGGLALASVAGARRATTAFPRLLAATDAGDLLVNPDNGVLSALDPAQLDDVPGVETSTYVGGVFVVVAADDGGPDFDVDVQVVAFSDGDILDRPMVREGRAPNPHAIDEAFISPGVAEVLDVEVGDTLDVVVSDLEGADACDRGDEDTCLRSFEPLALTIVGSGLAPDEVADPSVEDARLSLTGAFLEAFPDSIGYWGATLHLDGTATATEVSNRISALVPDEAVAFESTAGQLERFQASVRPQAMALSLFGLIVGATALLLAGLALVRQATTLAQDRRPLAAMGASPRTLVTLGAGHGLVCAMVGAAVAVSTAAAVSRLMPIGLAYDAEPDRGPDVDLAVLAAGVLAGVAVLLIASATATWRTLQRERVATPRGPAKLAGTIAALGGRPATVLGARFAFDPGSGDRAVPVRSTMATVAVAVAGTVAAMTFGASLLHLLATPSEYGHNWVAVLDFDPAELGLDAESDEEQEIGVAAATDAAAEDLARRSGVTGVSVMRFTSVEIAGEAVAALGIDQVTGAAHPTLVDGRLPAAPGEVVLGGRLLERTTTSVGDTIDISGAPHEVVGRGVFPGYAEYPGQDPTDLGVGAWLSVDGLDPLGAVFAGRHLLVDLDEGIDPSQFFDGYTAEGMFEDGVVLDEFRPSTVANLERVRSTPRALAVALAILGSLAAGHALALSVRRRRPVLAILRALGFDRRQVAATVSWQATWTALAAVAVGLPLGAVVGRLAWGASIHGLGGVSPAVVPWVTAASVALVTVLLANVVAALPARAAARIPTGEVLRVE